MTDWKPIFGAPPTTGHVDTPTSAAHTHLEADVTALVADLAGKSPTSHTHGAGGVPYATLVMLGTD